MDSHAPKPVVIANKKNARMFLIGSLMDLFGCICVYMNKGSCDPNARKVQNEALS
jgi:hypothetical protein